MIASRDRYDGKRLHVGNRVVRCLDIKTFFPNTPSRRVYWFYRSILGCSSDLAGLLTKLSTYQGHLPTGSPLSPILAFFTYHDVWGRIAELCAAKGHTLTVYVDDITISGVRVSDADVWLVNASCTAGSCTTTKKRFSETDRQKSPE